jgi:hypothetical protein
LAFCEFMKSKSRRAYLIASGDQRQSANETCWPEQARMEAALIRAFADEDWKLVRGYPVDKKKRHGFIDSQRLGIEIFRTLDPDAPLVVAEAVWQYSHHVLAGLTTHRGPILTVANFSGRWPGLVGLLNLNACLTKAGVRYSTIWSEDFRDEFFTQKLREWLGTGHIAYDTSHVRDFRRDDLSHEDAAIALRFAERMQRDKAILGVFDEGCMGMYNAIVPDELLHPTGVFKERLSQSTLFAAMQRVSDAEALNVYRWLRRKGMHFELGKDEATELTERQVLDQCRMYIAAVRLADEFGCDAIGIQYQQGLKDLAPASDLAEGLLNNCDRPPVQAEDDSRILYEGEAVPHFNEVDECAGFDALVTYRLWRELGLPPENTLHDLRWAQQFGEDYVWVLLISGAAPPAHFIGGWRGARSERQPPMYFRLGGGSLKGVSKPGHIVWSRVFVAAGKLQADIGVGRVVKLPEEETERRWRETTSQWPIMHAVFPGITRDQMMTRHASNHIQVVYTPSARAAARAARIKAATFDALGLQVHLCGEFPSR